MHPGRLPRRVIDVGSREPCLYETRGEFQEYVAVSHCWSHSLPIKTEKASLPSRQARLEWASLPVAFQESVQIARSLGIRYVWIDSLCIVQDDAEEWEIESGRMANIYENSFVTLALHQAAGGRSVLQPSLKSFSLSYENDTATSGFTPYVHFHLGYEKNWRVGSELTQFGTLPTRGWYFQVSQFHPPKILFFCG